MAQVNTYLNEAEFQAFQDKKVKLGFKSDYECAKHCLTEDISNKEQKIEVNEMSTKTLEAELMDLTKEDGIKYKTKKNSSWMPERFFNDMHDLYIHKAPLIEWFYFTGMWMRIDKVVQELIRRKVISNDYDWNKIHWNEARIRPKDYVVDSAMRKAERRGELKYGN